jgi:hypothetical protein
MPDALADTETRTVTESVLTISEVARRLGREGNRKLLVRLIRRHRIPTGRVGNSVIIDMDGFATLKRALKAWDNRFGLAEPPAD